MSTGKKIAWVFGIVGCVIFAYVLMTAAMPAITEMTEVAGNTTGIENYDGAKEAVDSAPFWLYFIPAVVGGVALIVVLKS